MRRFMVLAALVPVAAFAQSQSPLLPLPPALTTAQPRPLAEPPNYCDAYLPAAYAGRHSRNPTILSVHILESGAVTEAAVSDSSGDDVLDAAAITCAAHMNIEPAMAGGRPAAIHWKVEVAWQMQDHAWYFVPSPFASQRCEFGYLKGASDATGPTVIRFRVARDGSVQDTTVVKSSGSAAVDQAVIACTLDGRYPRWTSDVPDAEIWNEMTIQYGQ